MKEKKIIQRWDNLKKYNLIFKWQLIAVVAISVASLLINSIAGEDITPTHHGTDTIVRTLKDSRLQIIYLQSTTVTNFSTLLVPFFSAKESSSPLNIFRQLSARAPYRQNNNKSLYPAMWYAFQVSNSTDISKWILKIANFSVRPRLFQESGMMTDSLVEINGVEHHQTNLLNEFGKVYHIVIDNNSETRFLLELQFDGDPLIQELSFMPEVVTKPLETNLTLINGIVIGLLLVVGLTTLYFLLKSRDISYIPFIIYLAYITADKFFPIELHWSTITDSNYQVFYAIEQLLFFIILVIIPYSKNFNKQKIGLLVVLFLLYFFFQFYIFRQDIALGSNLINYLWTLFFICYFLYGYSFEDAKQGYTISNNIVFVISLVNIALLLIPQIDDNKISFKINQSTTGLELCIFYLAFMFRYRRYSESIATQKIQDAVKTQQTLSQVIIKNIEDDRKRVSQDLHDEIGGNLALLKLQLHNTNMPKEELNHILKLITQTSVSVRSIAYQLMPPHFEDTPLITILSEYIGRLNNTAFIKFFFSHNECNQIFSKEQDLTLFRIVTELLHNCVKHSGARIVKLDFHYGPIQLKITYEDNGVGFLPSSSPGIGLQSIHSRTQSLDGSLTIDKVNPTGIKILLTIPYPQ